MANVGSAYVTLMPSMKGFTAGVNKGISGIDTTASGKAMGIKTAKGFSGGFASGGIVAGAAMAVATKAMDAVTASMDRAIKRVDTMQNFPKVMTNLGYSAQDAARNIQTMSDGLDGLPTSLDAMVSMVQQLTPLSASMDEATQIGLAFNNMMLAGGANTQQQEIALLQYTQALAKGKFELQDWRILQQAMPGQLDQVAKAMLGTSAKSMDLYEAIKSGKVSMDDFNQAVLRLNTEGANGFASFEQQARDATTGIGTAMDNMATRTAKGVATLIDAIGQENISGAINYMSSGISGLANSLAGDLKTGTEFVKRFSGEIKGAAGFLMQLAPLAVRATGAVVGFKAARGVVSGVSGAFGGLVGNVNALGQRLLSQSIQWSVMGRKGTGVITALGSAMAGVTAGPMAAMLAGVAALGAVVAICAVEVDRAGKYNDNFRTSTEGVTSAVSGIVGPVDSASGSVEGLGARFQRTALDMDAFMERQAGYASEIIGIRDAMNENIGSLNNAAAAIEQYAGKTDLTTQEQGALKAAVEMVNDACGTQYEVIDAANGVISDSKGNYDEAKAAAGEYRDEIANVIEAKRKEYRVNAMKESLEASYRAEADAAAAYADAVAELAQKQTDLAEAQAAGVSGAALDEYANAVERAKGKVDDAAASVESCANNTKALEQGLGDAMTVADGAGSAMRTFADASYFDEFLQKSGHTVGEFEARMGELGISVATMQALSSDQLATMAANFNGSGQSIIDTLASMGISVGEYNATPLEDKYADAAVDDGDLIDAQGNLYRWDGSKLYDQYGNAVVDDRKLIDAQGRLWTWNASDMKWQDSGVDVDTGSMNVAHTKWVNMSFGRKVAQVVTQFIGAHAGGGIVKTHAGGGFVTTGVTDLGKDANGIRHIAGEAGAEWTMKHADGTTSIVPIENSRYLDPYANIIASKIPRRDDTVMAGMLAMLVGRMDSIENLLQAIADKDVDVYMDGERMSQALAQRTRLGMRTKGYA